MPLPIAAENTTQGHVLVVDDLPTNVKLLGTILRLAGFEVSTATSGIEALQILDRDALQKSNRSVPDVILLDVMMPEMDGFETCRRIREIPDTAHVPVVMVTALQEVNDRVKALEAGADDFLTKPVEEIEVVARVKTLVRAKRDRDQLEKAYADLRRSEELRDTLTHMLIHDLRTPLTGVLVSMQILMDEKAGALNEIQKDLVSISTRGGQNLINLVNDLLNIAKLESGQMELHLSEVSMPELAGKAIDELAHQFKSRQVGIKTEFAPDLPPIQLDADLLQRVLVNLMSNGAKFSPPGNDIIVGAHLEGDQMKVWVRDHGCGIAPEFHEAIWDKFGQAATRRENNRGSTGLGLTFCKLVVEAHGGQIGLESDTGRGCLFKFGLPLEQSVKG